MTRAVAVLSFISCVYGIIPSTGVIVGSCDPQGERRFSSLTFTACFSLSFLPRRGENLFTTFMVLVHSPAGSSHLFLRQDELLWEEKIRADWAAKGRDGTGWGYWHHGKASQFPGLCSKDKNEKAHKPSAAGGLEGCRCSASTRRYMDALGKYSTTLWAIIVRR